MSKGSYNFDRQALEDILNGATFLGSGGGGPYAGGKALLEDILKNTPGVPVIDAGDVPVSAMLAMVAGIGSPDAATHSSDPFTHAPKHAFQLLEQTINTTFDYVIAAEVGAMNSMIPMLLATQLNLPMIDADSAGRAIPELTMSTFAANVSIDPFVIANENDAKTPDISVVVHARTAADVEPLARGIIGAESFGEMGAFSTWAMNGAAMQQYSIAGTLALSRRIGCAIREAKATGNSPVMAVLDVLGPRAYLLYQGQIVKAEEQTTGGFDLGRVVMQGSDGSQAWIYNQNENLIAWQTDRILPLAMGPDSICYMTVDGQPFSNADIDDTLRAQQVVLIGLRADEKMRAQNIVGQFLEVFRTMGYAGPYIPIEDLY